ncbi:MAG: BamA/TamA family outer membrane protein, partial [Candidatus Marinimicrobia bacterium]|nr:BamA/TamA family outer membrane protein [Candidatus Neomarinimicrobiota bacterium]
GTQNWLFGTGYTDGKRDPARWNDDEDADIWDSENSNYLKDLYFSIFVLPIRGARLVEKNGTKVFLTNYEFRFPFVNYLALGFPLRIILGNIQGVLFIDAGAAWDDNFQFRSTDPVTGLTDFDDFVATYGAGLRLNIGYTIIRFDAAKDYTMHGSSDWQYYISLGTDF